MGQTRQRRESGHGDIETASPLEDVAIVTPHPVQQVTPCAPGTLLGTRATGRTDLFSWLGYIRIGITLRETHPVRCRHDVGEWSGDLREELTILEKRP